MRKHRGSEESAGLRIRLAVQRDRALIFSVALAVALVLQGTGTLHVSYFVIVSLFVVTNLSAWLLARLVRLGVPYVLHDVLWLGLDIGFVSWAVYETGGIDSPWYPWYLPVISGAAFVIGLWAAFWAFVISLAAYLGVLVLNGDLQGPGPELNNATAVMVCLYASSFLFLRGVRILQHKRAVIARMEAEGRHKLGELTQLARQLESTSDELLVANEKLRESDRLKSQFLANVSHELRTPLNSIIGFSEILANHAEGERAERESRYLDYIQRSGRRLLSVIDDILDLSRMEAGAIVLAPEKLAVRSTVEGVCTLLKAPANQKRVELRVEVAEDLPLVVADPARIKQILYHLVANAIKFSTDGGSVAVRGWLREEGAGPAALVLEVEDEGIGMEPAAREEIFRPFTQIDGSTRRRFEGAGLGLALVHEATTLHGGSVEVESEPGRGSVFRVTIPLGATAVDPRSDPATTAREEASCLGP